MNNEKIAKELLAQTRTPQDAFEYAIRREKGIENSRTMKINPFSGHQITTKQEPVNYINTRGRTNYSNSQNTQKGRGARGRPFQRGSQNNRAQTRATNTGNQKQCFKCGNQYNQNHLQTCPAKIKFVQSAPNGGTLPKYADQHKSTILKIPKLTNRRSLTPKVWKQKTTQWRLQNFLPAKVGITIK